MNQSANMQSTSSPYEVNFPFPSATTSAEKEGEGGSASEKKMRRTRNLYPQPFNKPFTVDLDAGKYGSLTTQEQVDDRMEIALSAFKHKITHARSEMTVVQLDFDKQHLPKLDVETATSAVAELREEHPDPICMSTEYRGSDGKPMLFYLGRRLHKPPGHGRRTIFDLSLQYRGRTEKDMDRRRQYVEDGIFSRSLQRYWETAQTLTSYIKLHMQEGPRHEPDQGHLMRWLEENPDGTTLTKEEIRGYVHFVQGWVQRGHRGVLYLSRDFLETSTGAQAVRAYYAASKFLALQVSTIFEVLMPEEHAKYKKIFDAGVWYPEEDPGPFLGRVVLWKLQLFPHQDSQDVGPTLSFAFGRYTGGYMEVPQLKARFLYKPGDVCLFYSSELWHSVSHWEPIIEQRDDNLTPGRGSTVFMCPEGTADVCENQEPGWGRKTGYGEFPSTSYICTNTLA